MNMDAHNHMFMVLDILCEMAKFCGNSRLMDGKEGERVEEVAMLRSTHEWKDLVVSFHTSRRLFVQEVPAI